MMNISKSHGLSAKLTTFRDVIQVLYCTRQIHTKTMISKTDIKQNACTKTQSKQKSELSSTMFILTNALK